MSPRDVVRSAGPRAPQPDALPRAAARARAPRDSPAVPSPHARRARRTPPAQRRARAPRCRARPCPRTGRARSLPPPIPAARRSPRARDRMSDASSSHAAPTAAGRRAVRRSRASGRTVTRALSRDRLELSLAVAPPQLVGQQRVLGRLEVGVGGDDRLRMDARTLEQVGILGQRRHREALKARLARAEQLALLAQPQVDLREREPVAVLRERAQALRLSRAIAHQKARARVRAAAHAAAQLVQLREAKSLRIL